MPKVVPDIAHSPVAGRSVSDGMTYHAGPGRSALSDREAGRSVLSCTCCVPCSARGVQRSMSPQDEVVDLFPGSATSAPPVGEVMPRQSLIEGLRADIRRLERGRSGRLYRSVHASPVPRGAVATGSPPRKSFFSQPVAAARSFSSDAVCAGEWTLGEPAFDLALPDGRLDCAALHELKPAAHGDWPGVLAFAAALAVRRRLSEASPATPPRPVLWCVSAGASGEHGGLHGAGLAHLGLSPACLIVVEVARKSEVLWSSRGGGALGCRIAGDRGSRRGGPDGRAAVEPCGREDGNAGPCDHASGKPADCLGQGTPAPATSGECAPSLRS